MDSVSQEPLAQGRSLTLSIEQEELCKRLDELYGFYNLSIKPSDMFRGALFAVHAEYQNNPDWVSQAANSLREILYPFYSREVTSVQDKKARALKKYGSVFADVELMQELGRVYGQLNDLAHHGATATNLDFSSFQKIDFEMLLADFELVMRKVLTKQLDLHKEIDEILSNAPGNK